MKKLTSLLVVLTLIIGVFPGGVTATENCSLLTSLGNYGDLSYIYENFELKFTYDGNTEIADKEKLTYNEFKALLTALSDEHLAPADKKTDKVIDVTDDNFPESGYVEFLDENDGNWVIGFDEEVVYARCINPAEKSCKHGFFTYTGTIDMGLWAFLKNLAKKDDEVITEPEDTSKEENTEDDLPVQEEIKRNRIEISDMKEIYSAHFPLDKFADAFSWGVCSYRRENESKDVTVAYITFEGMEFLKIITEDSIIDNTIVFNDGRVAYTKEHPGEEYDTDFNLTHGFELTVDVDEKMQVENARITYTHKSTNVTKTVDVDMSTYVQKGSLPTSGKIAFSEDNNSLETVKPAEDEQTKEETKEEETKLYRQTMVSNVNKFTLREKFEFDFIPDKTFEGFLTQEVGNIGERISGEVRIYVKDLTGKRNGEIKFFNITVLKGSKGEVELWGGFSFETDNFPMYKPTDMVMHALTTNRYLSDSSYRCLVRYSGEEAEDHRFMMQAEFDGEEIRKMKIKYVPEVNGKYDTYATMEGAIDCKNVKYDLLVPLAKMTAKEEKEEKQLENRNSEKYVTVVKGRMSDYSYHDYRINSIYRVPLNEYNHKMPEWYEALGRDVHMYLLSFTQVWDGVERDNYTMVKLEGSRDSIWFINGNAESGGNSDTGKWIVSEYESLISFDGFERVKNTLDYETIEVSARFNPDEEMTINNISVEVDGVKTSFNTDEITYIGGGKITYESFF